MWDTPVISPDSGTFDYATFVEITTTVPGGRIYYTTDGSDPDATDTLYTGQFPLASSATVGAIVIRDGDTNSAIASASITIDAAPARHGVSSGTYIEASGAQTINGMLRRPSAYAADSVYMLSLDDDEDGDDEYFDVDITCQSTGTYYLWLRCRATVYSRISVRLDAGAWETVTLSNNADYFKGWGWHWREVGLTYSLTNTVNYTFRVARTIAGDYSSPAVDRLYFTTNAAAEPSELELIHPNGGERWPLADDQIITWQSDGDVANVKIEVSYDSGDTWAVVVASTANDGSYTWTDVPVGATANCRIRISDPTDAKTFDMSDGDFCINPDANPFSPFVLLTSKLSQDVGTEYYEQGDRGDYLDDMEDLGDLQEEFAFRAILNLESHAPDTDAIDAFRTNNAGVTKLLTYCNLFNVHDRDGEAMMGDLTGAEYDDWFLYDAGSNIVTNPTQGRVCFDFRNTAFLDYMVGRIQLYYDAGTNGFEFDSFEILQKRLYVNGYWHDTYVAGVYSGDIDIQDPRAVDTYTATQWIADLRYASSYIRRALDEHYDNTNVLFAVNGLLPKHLEEYSDIVDVFYREGYAGPSQYTDELAAWWFTRNMFELTVNGLIQADALDKYAVLRFGYVYSNPWFQGLNTGSLYLAAAMLMGIRGPDTGVYLYTGFYTENWAGWANLRLARFVPEGRYYETGDDVYRREFQHAVVYCNPTDANQAGIALGDDFFYMQDNGTWSAGTIDTLGLDAGRGAILVLDKTWGDSATSTSSSTTSTSTTTTSTSTTATSLSTSTTSTSTTLTSTSTTSSSLSTSTTSTSTTSSSTSTTSTSTTSTSLSTTSTSTTSTSTTTTLRFWFQRQYKGILRKRVQQR